MYKTSKYECDVCGKEFVNKAGEPQEVLTQYAKLLVKTPGNVKWGWSNYMDWCTKCIEGIARVQSSFLKKVRK